MEKDVRITINGTQIQTDGKTTDDNTTVSVGKYIEKGDWKYLIYEEQIEGVHEPVKNMIKIGFNEVNMVKNGPVKTKMIFKPGRKQLTNYDTPYGGMTLGMKTSNIGVTQTDNVLIIEVDYKLDINYELFADCSIKITAKDM